MCFLVLTHRWGQTGAKNKLTKRKKKQIELTCPLFVLRDKLGGKLFFP